MEKIEEIKKEIIREINSLPKKRRKELLALLEEWEEDRVLEEILSPIEVEGELSESEWEELEQFTLEYLNTPNLYHPIERGAIKKVSSPKFKETREFEELYNYDEKTALLYLDIINDIIL